MQIKSKITTYELTVDELKKMFAKELGIKPEQLQLEIKMREIDDRTREEIFHSIEITVKELANANPGSDSKTV